MCRWWFCLPLLGVLAYAVLAAPNDPLPESDPLTFLEKCLEHYDRSGIKGYICNFDKQERINGELQPLEKTVCAFRASPHSVHLRWLEGERKASCVLYVEGENGNRMLARPTGFAGKLLSVVGRDVEGGEARSSSRYSLKTFGLRNALVRTLDAWKKARANGTLRVEYLGVRTVPETGGRACYVLQRTYAEPEEDGVRHGTFYIDKETWLQIGTVLKGEGDKLIGSYFFRNIQLNPEFKAEQFTRASLLP